MRTRKRLVGVASLVLSLNGLLPLAAQQPPRGDRPLNSEAVPDDEHFPPAKSPEESLATISVLAGLSVELVAAEPLVQDPVAFDWAPDGRMWVAEMADYPNGISWNKQGDPVGEPGGRIKLLTDRDGDGRYDTASLFLDKVPFPNGVKAWRNGVLVTAAPTIFYAEDTDGDGVADQQKTLYEGFAPGNQQHRANGLRWGVDNWLYVANGDSGGKVKSLTTGEELSISGRDLRIRPDDGRIEAQSGQTQFGRCRDDWGNWFGGNNANPLWHYVLDDHYLRRNPDYVSPSVRRDVPEVPGAAPVFPTSRTLARFNDFHTANRFTSACSPEVYRDELLADVLGEVMSVLICEPVHNLVHREQMIPEGISFRSRRPDTEAHAEFFASSDNWCRPVMVRTGPDGAIWIADMYRLVIEHPEWIPATWQRKLDLRAGADRGRIYRVSRSNDPPVALPRLDQLGTRDLVERLNSPNGWQRDMAQQLLIWRNDRDAVPMLEELLGSAERPTARLHALGTQDGMNQLSVAAITKSLKDRHPGVRRHAAQLSERFLRGDAMETNVLEALLELSDDADPVVRQQAAYSLGEVAASNAQSGEPLKRAGQALARIALRDPENPYVVAAVLSSITPENSRWLLGELLQASRPPKQIIQSLLSISARWKDPEMARQLILHGLKQANTDPQLSIAVKFDSLAELLEAIGQGRTGGAKLFDESLGLEIEPLAEQARGIAADKNRGVPERTAAIRLLGILPKGKPADGELLASLLAPRSPPEVQSAAVTALAARFPDHAARDMLLDWRSHSPALRAKVLDAIFTRPTWLNEFIAAIERGDVAITHIDPRRKNQLIHHSDRSIRERAQNLFKDLPATDRQSVIVERQKILMLTGDLANGKAAFGKKCSACHRLEETGQNVGPDLTALTDKTPRSMLVAILDPNKAVEDKFLDFLAVTDDGRQFTGMIVDETSTAVTLATQEGKKITLRRNELEALQSTGKSLMPEGLEKELTDQQFADVIAYVRSVSIPPKKFPGNEPRVAHVRDDGSIRLLAMEAKIYGPTLIFEEKYRNLGYWQSVDDYATWEIHVPKAGRYRVSIDYACDSGAAGSRFLISVGDQTAGGTVESTGSWDAYRNRLVGTIELHEGPAELLMRSDGAVHAALMDLRQIVLNPER